MDYNFDVAPDRRCSGSYKWDSDRAADDTLPLWVADMDFKTAPCIIDALQRRVEHGVFGYVLVDEGYYSAVCRWFANRHGWHIEPEWLQYTSGVVPALSAIVKAFTQPGDAVVVMTPVYNCFFSSIRNNGCTVAESPLLRDGDTYVIDYAGFEDVIISNRARMMILCNPHNPVGRVWTQTELMRVADICRRHGVQVISDEIHCELTFEGHDYTPFALVEPDCITCVSPSKAFNIAGLQIANIITRDPDRRDRIDRALNINEVCDVNPFGVAALKAAYSDAGADWLDALRRYLQDNYRMMADYCRRYLPGYPICRLEGTYLVWMDCRSAGMTSVQLEERLLRDSALWLNAGTMYGSAGEGFMRWNIACPRRRLDEALRRFTRFTAGLKSRG